MSKESKPRFSSKSELMDVCCELLMLSIKSFQIFAFDEHWYQSMPAEDKRNYTLH
jgi:hypothetical protein